VVAGDRPAAGPGDMGQLSPPGQSGGTRRRPAVSPVISSGAARYPEKTGARRGRAGEGAHTASHAVVASIGPVRQRRDGRADGLMSASCSLTSARCAARGVGGVRGSNVRRQVGRGVSQLRARSRADHGDFAAARPGSGPRRRDGKQVSSIEASAPGDDDYVHRRVGVQPGVPRVHISPTGYGPWTATGSTRNWRRASDGRNCAARPFLLAESRHADEPDFPGQERQRGFSLAGEQPFRARDRREPFQPGQPFADATARLSCGKGGMMPGWCEIGFLPSISTRDPQRGGVGGVSTVARSR